MSSKNLIVSLFLTLFLFLFFVSTSITADDSSEPLKGTVVLINEEGKECSGDCASTHSEKSEGESCIHKYALKTSDGKIHLFNEEAKKASTLENYVGKNVEVSGYICPVSKKVNFTDLKLQASKTAESGSSCPSCQTSAAESNK